MPHALGTLAGTILLPIVPAVIIFWLLPSTTIVSGPLQGVRIDPSGAFAGYFALVLLVLFPTTYGLPRLSARFGKFPGKSRMSRSAVSAAAP